MLTDTLAENDMHQLDLVKRSQDNVIDVPFAQRRIVIKPKKNGKKGISVQNDEFMTFVQNNVKGMLVS